MTTTNSPAISKRIVAGRRPSDGTLFLATNDGARIDFPGILASDVAVMLAELCLDNMRRAHVESEWHALEDEDVADMTEELGKSAAATNADLPATALARFPIDPTTDAVVAFVAALS